MRDLLASASERGCELVKKGLVKESESVFKGWWSNVGGFLDPSFAC